MGEGGQGFGRENRLRRKAEGEKNTTCKFLLPSFSFRLSPSGEAVKSSFILQAAAAFAGAIFPSGMKTISRLAKSMVPARK